MSPGPPPSPPSPPSPPLSSVPGLGGDDWADPGPTGVITPPSRHCSTAGTHQEMQRMCGLLASPCCPPTLIVCSVIYIGAGTLPHRPAVGIRFSSDLPIDSECQIH
ncbi:unnamed protein product [Pleuronectes platessa]|uniref:Uncharacterized protein n=1 Tax=Pleuronectes platessa TaxID=8262 RepID=A0A9N7UTQ0_PLEPL|nr:unnamed protein product [Pleuronectes platessa]